MEDWDWTVVVAALFGVVGTVGAQVTLGRGEPGKLKTLRLFNQVITEFGEEDGRTELIAARASLAQRVSASYLKEPFLAKVFPPGLVRALASFVSGYAIFIVAAVLLAGPDKIPKVWEQMLPIGQVGLFSLALMATIVILFSLAWIVLEMVTSPSSARDIRRVKIWQRARRVARLGKTAATTAEK